jgi:hypothetical protein
MGVISLMSRALSPRGNSPQYPSDWRLGGLIGVGLATAEKKKNPALPTGNRTPTIQLVARRYTDSANPISILIPHQVDMSFNEYS